MLIKFSKIYGFPGKDPGFGHGQKTLSAVGDDAGYLCSLVWSSVEVVITGEPR